MFFYSNDVFDWNVLSVNPLNVFQWIIKNVK